MALDLVLDSLPESMNEAIKGEYVKKEDGKFYLQTNSSTVGDKTFSVEDVGGLKGSLAKERENVQERDNRLKAFEGIDATKARSAIKSLENMGETVDSKAQELFKTRETALTTKHAGELETASKREAQLLKELRSALVTSAAATAIAEHKGNQTLLLGLVEKQCDIREVDGKFLVDVLGPGGTPRISMESGSTDPMKISELVKEMKGQREFAPAFEGSRATGSGATGDAAGSQGSGGEHTITQTDSKDIGKYKEAKAAADKAGAELQIVEG